MRLLLRIIIRIPPLRQPCPRRGLMAQVIPLYYPQSRSGEYRTIANGAPERRGKAPGRQCFPVRADERFPLTFGTACFFPWQLRKSFLDFLAGMPLPFFF